MMAEFCFSLTFSVKVRKKKFIHHALQLKMMLGFKKQKMSGFFTELFSTLSDYVHINTFQRRLSVL